jgi:eukaryotic-like serine/threonine-protein kinase
VISQLMGQQTVGRFEIRDFLGRGAIGDVLLAWDGREERLVALKVVRVARSDPEMLEAEKSGLALQEQLARVAPQVAAVYEVGEDGDFFWVAMEYVDGTDLSRILTKGPLPERRAVAIAFELVSMLEVCHEFSAEVAGRRILGIVHGDIKPENIRLQGEPGNERVRVLDFGIAKHLTQTRRFTVNLFGSLPYTPPERLERGVVDRHSDLWAVGVVLAAMVSGRRPFPGNTAEDLEQAIRRGVPCLPLPASCSAELEWIVYKSLTFEVRRRYQAAAELRADLAALRDGLPLPSMVAVRGLATGVVAAAGAGQEGADLHATRRTARPPAPADRGQTETTRRTDGAAARFAAAGAGAGSTVAERAAGAPEETRRTGAGPGTPGADVAGVAGGAVPGVPVPGEAPPGVAARDAAPPEGAAAQPTTSPVPGSAAAVQVPGLAPGAGAPLAGFFSSAPASVAPIVPAPGAPEAPVLAAPTSPAPVAPGSPPAARAAGGRRRVVWRLLIPLLALALLAGGAAQLWAWSQANELRRALAEPHPDLQAIAQRYSRAASWSLLSPDLFGVGDELLKSLTASAGRILDSYHGDDPTTTQRGWQAANDLLHTAVEVAPHDHKLRARLLYSQAHLDRIQSVALRTQGDRKKAADMSREAAGEFQEAARWDPEWPDPYLGLARIYAYDLFDLAALQKTLGELSRRGYAIGRRESAMLADGFRMQGLGVAARAQRARGTSGEADLLKEAQGDLEQAVRLYGGIGGFADSSDNRDEAQEELETVAARLAQLEQIHPPGFWERIGRALVRELRKPGGQ